MCEISTPFLHFRWFLATSGYRHATLYYVNSAIFSLLFLAVRGAFMTLMLYRIFSTLSNPFYWPDCAACTVTINCAWAFQGLQYMWCVKVITGFVAIVFGKGKKDKLDAEHEADASKKKQA